MAYSMTILGPKLDFFFCEGGGGVGMFERPYGVDLYNSTNDAAKKQNSKKKGDRKKGLPFIIKVRSGVKPKTKADL